MSRLASAQRELEAIVTELIRERGGVESAVAFLGLAFLENMENLGEAIENEDPKAMIVAAVKIVVAYRLFVKLTPLSVLAPETVQ